MSNALPATTTNEAERAPGRLIPKYSSGHDSIVTARRLNYLAAMFTRLTSMQAVAYGKCNCTCVRDSPCAQPDLPNAMKPVCIRNTGADQLESRPTANRLTSGFGPNFKHERVAVHATA